jgi:PncC family amidohydrolase
MNSAAAVIEQLKSRGLWIVCVESCTGGALANALTDISGSSDAFSDGFVVYSNEAKLRLGVPASVIEKHSVYSLDTALEMAKAGLKQAAHGDIGVGITGKIPGQVYLAVKWGEKVSEKKVEFQNKSRRDIKALLVEEALGMVLRVMG